MRELYAAITQGKEHKTTPTDVRNDIILVKMIMNALVA